MDFVDVEPGETVDAATVGVVDDVVGGALGAVVIGSGAE